MALLCKTTLTAITAASLLGYVSTSISQLVAEMFSHSSLQKKKAEKSRLDVECL